MAAPRLTTCQVPPCANPSFETFVASRANGQEVNGKHMSVVDILNDIKVSESNIRATSAFEEKRQMATSGSKPVVCPKEGCAFLARKKDNF